MSATEDKVIPLTPDRVLRLLAEGEIEVEGLIPCSSNATVLVTVKDGELTTLAVYKPQRGERPLWDFPRGSLGKREVASYLVCEALGWSLIPPTVLRSGPYGPGSVQFFIHTQEEENYFTFCKDRAFSGDLRRLAAFDLVANNADRKAGHCLLGIDGRLWAIDNALTFHVEPKLRTVIWDFAGQPLPDEVMAALKGLQTNLLRESPLSRALASLLSAEEMAAFQARLDDLIAKGCYAQPGPERHVPWPLV